MCSALNIPANWRFSSAGDTIKGVPIVNLEAWVDEILQSRKYHRLDLPRETVRDLLEQELKRYRDPRDAQQAARKKLHGIIAPYLGDPDYDLEILNLRQAYVKGQPAFKEACLKVLKQHASTLERIPILDEFYARIFAFTGEPHAILDVACALHPLSLPWMNLSASIQYHAYDLHTPRVTFLNQFFELQGLPALAEVGDILLNPPQVEAETAFFFKEAHRFEVRQHGCNRAFWQALKVHWLLVSLPTHNLSKHHSLLEQQRALVAETTAGLPWKINEILFADEIVFCVEKQP